MINNSIRVSICIPSLNRPEYLLGAIESICNSPYFKDEFEICIFNNCSDESYFAAEKRIEQLSVDFNLSYLKGLYRLTIDQSMFNAIKMAKGEYLFLLGDDDFFLPGAISNIVDLIKSCEFDLAVFNAVILNEKNNSRTDMFGFRNVRIDDLRNAVISLKNYCSYGNILIRSSLIDYNDFQYLDGTSHAYGCFWLAFFRNYEAGIVPKIIVPNSPVVCLRAILKTYNLLQVTFEHSRKELDLYYKVLGDRSKLILEEYESLFWQGQSSFVKLILYSLAGNDLSKISDYNMEFYRRYKGRILFVRILTFFIAPLKKPLKYFFLRYKQL